MANAIEDHPTSMGTEGESHTFHAMQEPDSPIDEFSAYLDELVKGFNASEPCERKRQRSNEVNSESARTHFVPLKP